MRLVRRRIDRKKAVIPGGEGKLKMKAIFEVGAVEEDVETAITL
jgi:hypothetical protein